MLKLLTLFLSIIPMFAVLISALVTVTPLSAEAAEPRQIIGSYPIRKTIKQYYGVRSAVVPKVIGGKIANWNDHKWQVALLISWIADPERAQFCGGSLVRQDWVVTAAHCVNRGTLPEDIHALSGTADLRSGGKRVNVDAIYIHEDYDYITNNNDIALLKLNSNGIGQSIKLVSLDEEPNIVVSGENAMITGWGTTESGLPSHQLKQVEVPLVDRKKCNGPASYDGSVTVNMICAGIDLGGMDSCQGDSGGPNTKNSFLIGIVSWGQGCAKPFKYGVYTRVAKYSNWVETCIKDPALCKSK